MEKVDFVVTWVNGNDAAWQAERSRFLTDEEHDANAVNRFRDWNLMRYWFRGIEKFAPWVNNIYFVTWGHYPEWLNIEHPKLRIIKHDAYIPVEYLPTYNSNVIELFMHNISELSEQFVLFNDDTFLTDRVKEIDFFQHGFPCETVRLGMVDSADIYAVFPHTVLNNAAIINKHFVKREVLKKYWNKFFSIKYGVDVLRNFLLMPFEYFSAFYDTHLPASHLKSTFYEVWEKEPDILKECGTHRFRTREDVTHWLMKNWRFCKGEFVPRSNKWGRCFEIGQDEDMIDAIKKQKYKAICLNDSDPNLDFEKYQKELINAFETILPEKSSFEK